MRRCVALFAYLLLAACASSPPAPPSTPTVTLTWNPVTTLTDGSALDDLTGYEVSYGPVGAPALQESVNATTCTLNVSAGAYSFSVAAVSASHGLGLPATVTYTVP